MVDSDAGIACFDAKYHYTFWRPVTAINHADIDGNPATVADTSWTCSDADAESSGVSGRARVPMSADIEVLEAAGERDFSVDIPGATNGGSTLTTSRHYDGADQLATEIVNARVWAGLHFRYSGETGVDLGKEVARWAIGHTFRPDRSALSEHEARKRAGGCRPSVFRMSPERLAGRLVALTDEDAVDVDVVEHGETEVVGTRVLTLVEDGSIALTDSPEMFSSAPVSALNAISVPPPPQRSRSQPLPAVCVVGGVDVKLVEVCGSAQNPCDHRRNIRLGG